jgi:hypothetical protein
MFNNLGIVLGRTGRLPRTSWRRQHRLFAPESDIGIDMCRLLEFRSYVIKID